MKTLATLLRRLADKLDPPTVLPDSRGQAAWEAYASDEIFWREMFRARIDLAPLEEGK